MTSGQNVVSTFKNRGKVFQNFPVDDFLNMVILQICNHVRVTELIYL